MYASLPAKAWLLRSSSLTAFLAFRPPNQSPFRLATLEWLVSSSCSLVSHLRFPKQQWSEKRCYLCRENVSSRMCRQQRPISTCSNRTIGSIQTVTKESKCPYHPVLKYSGTILYLNIQAPEPLAILALNIQTPEPLPILDLNIQAPEPVTILDQNFQTPEPLTVLALNIKHQSPYQPDPKYSNTWFPYHNGPKYLDTRALTILALNIQTLEPFTILDLYIQAPYSSTWALYHPRPKWSDS